MTKEVIVIIVESVVLFCLIVVLTAIGLRARKKKRSNARGVYVKDGVRYTYGEDAKTPEGDLAITHNRGDILLEKGVTYIVRKDGKIIPGKYTMLTAQENAPTFNVRMGDFVREYKHDSDVVLSEGEKICPVSHSIILR